MKSQKEISTEKHLLDLVKEDIFATSLLRILIEDKEI